MGGSPVSIRTCNGGCCTTWAVLRQLVAINNAVCCSLANRVWREWPSHHVLSACVSVVQQPLLFFWLTQPAVWMSDLGCAFHEREREAGHVAAARKHQGGGDGANSRRAGGGLPRERPRPAAGPRPGPAHVRAARATPTSAGARAEWAHALRE
eukprot:357412-Chlamydomonas_euryale.AAC.1